MVGFGTWAQWTGKGMGLDWEVGTMGRDGLRFGWEVGKMERDGHGFGLGRGQPGVGRVLVFEIFVWFKNVLNRTEEFLHGLKGDKHQGFVPLVCPLFRILAFNDDGEPLR